MIKFVLFVQKVHEFKGAEKVITQLLPFGPHLICVDDNTLRAWEIKTEEMTITLPFNVSTFAISCLIHPATYINKVLLGSAQGSLQLWNIRKLECIYTFNGWGHEVTHLCQAPAVDIVAIGLISGSIFIHNLKSDSTLIKFKQEFGCITDLSFRTDGEPFLVSSSSEGHLAIWDLEKKKLTAQMRNIHQDTISGCNFVHNEPLLVTNSNDNSLKVWCFDQTDLTGRILYQREGHRLPPTRIRFHGSKGQYILSAGCDSTLRMFSIYSERLNRNLGTASFQRKSAKRHGIQNDPYKMPPITEFTVETTREKEWDNIAAVHQRTDITTTWSFDKCKMGEHKLLNKRFRGMRNVVANVSQNVTHLLYLLIEYYYYWFSVALCQVAEILSLLATTLDILIGSIFNQEFIELHMGTN